MSCKEEKNTDNFLYIQFSKDVKLNNSNISKGFRYVNENNSIECKIEDISYCEYIKSLSQCIIELKNWVVNLERINTKE